MKSIVEKSGSFSSVKTGTRAGFFVTFRRSTARSLTSTIYLWSLPTGERGRFPADGACPRPAGIPGPAGDPHLPL